VAFDIQQFPDRIQNDQIIRPVGGLPEWVLLVAGLVVFLIFVGSVVYIRVFRKPELIGLDQALVVDKAAEITDEAITESLDQHSLGVVVSFFAQQHGPIPIIVIPEILKDNFGKLIEISDRAFSNCGFATDFEKELMSSFHFDLTRGKPVHSMSFGFALNRPEARGGQENIAFSILLNEDVFPILNHFQEEILTRVHVIHKMMDERQDEKMEISKAIGNLRRYLSSLVLSYGEIYGDESPIMEMPEILGFTE
jgi:hypothetical protein